MRATAGGEPLGRPDRLVTAGGAPLLAAGFLAAGLFTVVLTAVVVVRLHVPLPYWDQWQTVAELRAYARGDYGWGDLVSQHNEHRLLFPRLFFFADSLLFGLSGVSDLVTTLVLQAATAAVLIAILLRRVDGRAHRVLLSGFVMMMLFTLRQEQNFSNGFQLQFMGVFTAAVAAVVAYGRALERLMVARTASRAGFALAALASAVSTYTMANGVLVGFALTGASLMRRAPARVTVITLLLSIGLAAIFFHHYVPGADSYPLDQVLPHALDYALYLTAYLGNPIGSNIPATQALGLAGLLLLAAAIWQVTTRQVRDPSSLVLVTIAGFILATGAATTWGRVALGTGQASESRYATPASLFWVALVLFWWPVALRVRPRWRLPAVASAAALTALVALLAGAALTFELTAWPDMAAQSTALRAVSDSLMAGLLDAQVAEGYENTPSDEIRALVPFLRDHHLAIFATPEAEALGRPLAALGPAAPRDDCSGTITARSDPALGADGGMRAEGTAWDNAGRGPVRRILLVGPAGAIAGYGSASRPGRPKRLWSGYAKGAVGERLSAAAELADGRVCPLGDATVLPAF